MSYAGFKFIVKLMQNGIERLDPIAFEPLCAHNGKSIKMTIKDYFSLDFTVEQNRLSLQTPNPSRLPCCTINGTLSAFLDVIFKHRRFIPGQNIFIEGDTRFAQDLFDIFRNLDPDWASQFETIFPKPIIALGSNSLEKIKKHLNTFKETRTKDIQAFLQDEKQWLPPRYEYDSFLKDLQDLQTKVTNLDHSLINFKHDQT